ncbi:hypothetical protein K1719_047251 [Acacia pycnantha]|nr:hypothetical protein K1719_047251 [Acacia pycnantha]
MSITDNRTLLVPPIIQLHFGFVLLSRSDSAHRFSLFPSSPFPIRFEVLFSWCRPTTVRRLFGEVVGDVTPRTYESRLLRKILTAGPTNPFEFHLAWLERLSSHI